MALTGVDLDPNSPLPLWHQIYDHLVREIAGNELPPETLLESEKQLCRQYGVSRITLRRALAQLVTEGWLVRTRPRGPLQVRTRTIEQELARLEGFFWKDVARSDQRPTTQVLGVGLEPAGEIAPHLRLAQDEKVFRVERLHSGNDRPLALQVSFIPYERLPDLRDQDLNSSLLTLLESRGHVFHSAEQRVRARLALPEEVRLLDLEPGAIVIGVLRTSYDPAGEPIEYLRALMPAGRYELIMHLDRNTSGMHFRIRDDGIH